MADDVPELSPQLSVETGRLKGELGELDRLGKNFGQTMSRAFAGAILDGRKLSDVLRSLALSLSRQALSAGLKPFGNLIGGAITPFAQGGIVSSPTLFALGRGAGLAGEAGPEAILPLSRGADGRLGVEAQAGRAVNVTVNIQAADVESFRRSQSQIAAAMLRGLERGRGNL